MWVLGRMKQLVLDRNCLGPQVPTTPNGVAFFLFIRRGFVERIIRKKINFTFGA